MRILTVKSLVILLFILFLFSCHKKSNLEQALELAGNNRTEMENVLQHYNQNPCDSLKYKAACFLIENMKYKFSFTKDTNNQWIIKSDIKEMRDSLLINHIDNVFMAENYQWTKRIPFPDFCEYLLPYRMGNEPLENWMPVYRKYLSAAIDSLSAKNLSDSAVCAYLITTLFTSNTLRSFSNVTDPIPSSLLDMKDLDCRLYAMLGCYVMQTLGIPVAWDFTPQWANRSMGHDWNVLLSSKRPIPFLFGDQTPFGEHFTNERKCYDKLAKVYRRTFEIQQNSLALLNIKEDIPPFFNDTYFKDVSEFYFTPFNVKVKFTIPPPKKKKIAYIMVFDNTKWQPIHWAKIKGRKATFANMAAGCMYIVMYYHANQFFPASNPFYINDSGNIEYIKANQKEPITISLFRKYPDVRMRTFCKEMIGGCFQASNNEKIRDNDKHFKDMDVLYAIEKVPEVKWYDIKVNNPKKYRYVRYWSGFGGWGNMAEIEFYTSNEGQPEKLSGKIIGTEPNYITDGTTRSLAFDGDPLTYFVEYDSNGAWVGLDLGTPQLIDSIRFLPRNDDNNIRIGDEYELMYWDKGKWISLGKQKAKDYVLHYMNVPENALYLLHDNTRGAEERIFTYENGKQVWW